MTVAVKSAASTNHAIMLVVNVHFSQNKRSDKMSFDKLEINPVFLDNIRRMGFNEMFPVQRESIPQALRGEDLVVQAKTGSGKTLCFAIPVCERIDAQEKSVQALVLTPTRELAVQVHGEIEKLCEGSKIRSYPVYGGISLGPQIKAIHEGAQIIVGTPGRIMDLMRRGNLKFDFLKVAVLDEGDRMLDMGFRDDIEFILSATPKDRQTMLFSATVPPEINYLIEQNLDNPRKIRIGSIEKDVTQVDQFYVDCDFRNRFNRLCNLLVQENIQQAIIFCNTKWECDKLSRNLKRYDFRAVYLHGDLSQNQRDMAMADFRKGNMRFLVATDLAARGLDIEGISHVINYGVPKNTKDYVHRIGRTARAGEEGVAITFLMPESYDDFSRIKRELDLEVGPVVVEIRKDYYFENSSRGRGSGGRMFGGRGRNRTTSRGNYSVRSDNRRGYNPALGYMGTVK